MNKHLGKLISVLLLFCMLLSLFSGAYASPSATKIITEPSGYTSASEVYYRNYDGYIANWGARGENCTFLSTYAQSFYTGTYGYDTLSRLSGGTSTTAPSSPLYVSLNGLMVGRHTYFTKYGTTSSSDCKNLYQYTDCMLGDPSYVSTYYRGEYVTGPWNSGSSYNQEHVWPRSKCIGTASTDIGDIMQLRAANPSENSSRGNTAYGESSGYYDPGISVRGDCARTLLYMYVRWENTGYMWGTDGVIESLDVLLRWMQEDPVDTWEMGRNDAIQSITGTRNVFVDYPELAWLLFSRSVPSDLETPSNGTVGNGGNNSGGSDSTEIWETATLVKDLSSLKIGDRIIITALDHEYAMSTTQNTGNRGETAVKKTGSVVNYSDDAQVITLDRGTISGTFALSVGYGQYLYAASSSSNYLKTTDSISDNASWSISIDASSGVATLVAAGSYTHNVMRYNYSYGIFSCYAANNTQKDIAIYKIGSSEGAEGGTDDTIESVTLVTNASTLKAGDQVIIAALDYEYALSITQNTNNRSQAAVTKNGTTLIFDASTQIITLENGNVGGTFALKVGSGQYLCAASSSGNYLKTVTTISDNGSWSISIASATGAATLTANGNYTRNVMRYNYTSGLFSCYAATNSQKDLCIYKVVLSNPECSHRYVSKITIASSCTTAGVKTYTCSDCGDSYTESTPATGHSYSGGKCISCGVADPNTGTISYYLFGYINGTDYACGANDAELGSYKFVNGKLKATFNCDSYVGVKTSDNAKWYMTNGWQGTDKTSVTLYDASKLSTVDKFYVPGNVELIFTLKENSDGSLTLSYAPSTCEHTYSGGVCTKCGETDPNGTGNSEDYYLFGYINGQDYGSETDDGNVGQYRFVNGKLTVTFTTGSYIAVKTGDNAHWYMTDGWQGMDKTGVTLYDTTKLSDPDKFYVPGNVQLTFVLTENSDGSLNLRYTVSGDSADSTSTVPTFTLKYPTLSFEEMVLLNIYYEALNVQDVEEMGLITYDSTVTNVNINTADKVIPGYTWSQSAGLYFSSSEGIAAKNLGDTLYFAVYARLKDGTYAYSKLANYSPKTYAYNQLKSGTAEMKQLVVAMLNYGAAAQVKFDYKINTLVNADLTASQKSLITDYSSSMVTAVTQPTASQMGQMINNGGYVNRYPTVSFEGVFSINYYFQPSKTPVGNITMYMWTQEDYKAAGTFTRGNATMVYNMTPTSSSEYLAVVDGIAAKDLDDVVYVSFCYSDGSTSYCSGVVAYSIGQYCKTQAAKTGTMADLAKACAVYGYYAKQRFG